MSTSETVTLDANVCPCGCGKILKHVTTQDNPWSSADISYELSCDSCEANWILENTGVALVSKREATEENSAREAWLQAGEPLRALVEELVSGYFARFAAPSKKAEWREMQRLDIYKGSYRNFLQDKAKGERPGQIAYGLRNRPWLAGLAEERNRQSELKQLIVIWDARKDAWEQAARRVRRWPVDPPRDRA